MIATATTSATPELLRQAQIHYRLRLEEEIEREHAARLALRRREWEGGLLDARGLMLLAR